MNTGAPAAAEFLGARHPFDRLPASVLEQVAADLEVTTAAAGTVLFAADEPVTHLYIVRRGSVEVRDLGGGVLARLVVGDVLGQDGLLSKGPSGVEARALTDSELYLLPAARFEALCRDHDTFRYFVSSRESGGTTTSADEIGDGASLALMSTPVAQIVSRSPVTVAPETSIAEAARVMTDAGISSLLVVSDGELVGILTDRDLRRRVVAAGRSLDDPVRDVMSPDPVSIDRRRPAYEALLRMARSHYHHLPVLDGGELIGMITDTDLLQRHSTSPLFVIGDIHRCDDLESLVQASASLSRLLVAMVDASAAAESIGRAVSAIGEAINVRLLVLAERRLGPPPVPYAWLTGGSLGRQEQTAHSDQDNCLLLSERFDQAQHGQYFERLSTFVCDGLNACGYVYCPGDIMAKTPKWRQPLSVWKGYFDGWIDRPEPKALMHASIFFDLRILHGDQVLFGELQAYVLAKAKANHIFHAFMTSNALTHEPPIGFFRNFVLVRDGEHDRTLDLKHTGVIPIVDIARIYALVGGISAVNTRERLDAAERGKGLSVSGAADLRDALEFIANVRLRHQARQIRHGVAPDNFVPPNELSNFERNHLKDAFAVVRTIQSALSQRYQAGRLG